MTFANYDGKGDPRRQPGGLRSEHGDPLRDARRCRARVSGERPHRLHEADRLSTWSPTVSSSRRRWPFSATTRSDLRRTRRRGRPPSRSVRGDRLGAMPMTPPSRVAQRREREDRLPERHQGLCDRSRPDDGARGFQPRRCRWRVRLRRRPVGLRQVDVPAGCWRASTRTARARVRDPAGRRSRRSRSTASSSRNTRSFPGRR